MFQWASVRQEPTWKVRLSRLVLVYCTWMLASHLKHQRPSFFSIIRRWHPVVSSILSPTPCQGKHLQHPLTLAQMSYCGHVGAMQRGLNQPHPPPNRPICGKKHHNGIYIQDSPIQLVFPPPHVQLQSIYPLTATDVHGSVPTHQVEAASFLTIYIYSIFSPSGPCTRHRFEAKERKEKKRRLGTWPSVAPSTTAKHLAPMTAGVKSLEGKPW